MNTTTRMSVAVLAFAGLCSCSSTRADGGQTGAEPGNCWGAQTPLALDALSPLGFSPNDSLNLAQGKHSATFNWIPSADHPYGPESGEGTIDITVTGLGTAVYATPDYTTNQHQVTTDLGCAPAVLSDVAVTLHTDGGAFDESFNARLAASTRELTTLNSTVLGAHVAGSFAFDASALGALRLAQVNLSASFGANTFGGSLEALLEQTQGSGAGSVSSALRVPLACWGNASGCVE